MQMQPKDTDKCWIQCVTLPWTFCRPPPVPEEEDPAPSETNTGLCLFEKVAWFFHWILNYLILHIICTNTDTSSISVYIILF